MQRCKRKITSGALFSEFPQSYKQALLGIFALLPGKYNIRWEISRNQGSWVALSAAARFLLLVLTACAVILRAQTVPLSFRPLAAQYSSALDRIVMISASPDVLHIYDPAANSDVTVPLGSTPSSLSVSPDGLHAAVGGSTAVYYVNLQTASIENTYQGGIGYGSVLLSNSALYISLLALNGGSMSYVDLVTGRSTALDGSSISQSSGVNPVNGQIYEPGGGSPTFMYRLVVDGTYLSQIAWPYFDTYPVRGNIWFSPDGSRIYAGNGTVVKSSTDPTTDMTYLTTLPSGGLIQSLTESAALSQVAYISQPSAYATNTLPSDDTHVNLLNSRYLTPAGSFGLTPFHVGNIDFTAHGRWVFFSSDGSNLYVLNQADVTSGLTNDFALQTIPLRNPNSCAVALDTSSVHDIGDGGMYTINLRAGTTCTFSATADRSWIVPVSGAYGSGNTPLVFELRRNTTGQPRSGSIVVGGQTIAITQEAAVSNGTFVPLSFNVIAAEYDKVLDRFVMVSAAPNELHIFDPVANTDQAISLGPTPLSVSLSMDGTHAAVGHDGWLSYVDLVNAQVSGFYALQDVANTVALATNGYAYTFGSSATYLNLSSGTSGHVSLTFAVDAARIGPADHFLYVDYGLALAAYNLQSSPALGEADFPLVSPYNACGRMWFMEDGTRLLTGCGMVLGVSNTTSKSFTLAGSAPLALGGFRWADDSQAAGTIAVIPGNVDQNTNNDAYNTSLQLYSRNDFTLRSQVPAPFFSVGGKNYAGHGHVVSWNSFGSTVFVLEQADSTAKLASSYAISTISNPGALPPCAYSIDAPEIFVASTTNLMPLPGRSTNCSWTFTTDVSWIRFFIEDKADADQSIQLSLQENQGATPRTGHIRIGNKSITVTQNPAGCTLQLNLPILTFYSEAAAQAIPFTTGNSCAWTATTGAPWITINGPSAGTGTAVISISVAQNTTGSYRRGTVLIGGQPVDILQNSIPEANLEAALGFVPMTPCRVVDTRNPDGPFGGPLITGQTSRDFVFPLSPCGIPASAQAYALNVTVVPSGPLGYLTVSPSGGARPTVSTLNSLDGRVKANAAIVAAGSAGALNVYASHDTHVIIDITGYFDHNSNARWFVPVPPCRIMDTRNSDGPLGGPFLPGSSPRDVPVLQSLCGIRYDIFRDRGIAYSLNFTVAPRGPLSYLTAWPTGQTRPTVSTLNAPTGTVAANAALLQADYGGSISVFSTQDTDLVIDTNGYFALPAASGGLRFYPTTPCRALDTRTGDGPLSGAATFDAGTACGVPVWAQAVVLNATVVPHGPLSYLTLWPAGQPQPVVSTLNAPDGMVTSNLAIVPANRNQIGAFSAGTTDLILDVFGYFAP